MKPEYWNRACAELSAQDKVMAAVIARYDGEFLCSRGDAFFSLARSIVGQQISVKAAESVWNKCVATLGEVAPEHVARSEDDALRGAGLSRQKVTYMKSLAQHFLDGHIHPELFPEKSDEEIIADLTRVKGIGRWSAEMFLIFHLLRPDIYPIADIGLQKAVRRSYDKEAAEMGDIWRPWRSVATWYLWRSLDPVPVEY